VGKAGLIGVHTIVILNKGGWAWPCEEEGERGPQPRRRWSADKSFESASALFKFDFKEYELKLLAAFARCYRGEITLKQLPMIPAQMAELILRSSGGLTEWINSDEKRLKRFLKWSASSPNRNQRRRST
jgi:hypothetical protein